MVLQLPVPFQRRQGLLGAGKCLGRAWPCVPSSARGPSQAHILFVTSFPDVLTYPWASRLERLCPGPAGPVELPFEMSKGPGWPVWERGSGPLCRGVSAPVTFDPDSLSLPGLKGLAGRGTTFSLCLVSGAGSMGKARVAVSLVHNCPWPAASLSNQDLRGENRVAQLPPGHSLAQTPPHPSQHPGCPQAQAQLPWSGPLEVSSPCLNPPPPFHCHFLPPSKAPPAPEWGEALFPSCGHFPTILSSSVEHSGAKLQAGTEGSPGTAPPSLTISAPSSRPLSPMHT